MTRCYIGLGSNLAGPEDQIRRAFRALAKLPESRLVGQSSLYRSAPMGPPGQPDYVNAVAVLDTRLDPEALLDALQAIEAAHHRRRDGERWGPRTLDLDLLLFGDEQIDEPDLTVPHPEMTKRGFVLYPLLELEPGLHIPGEGPAADRLAGIDETSIERLTA
ncbi:MAG TPA: 2-amino-4-hydroxy-6-hydroxymethyldihydropteridine diphosphokinase [Gammaproteobacteria bacterium]|nr:2-amino-4-hydroxy-6-hydroxymethyldihydropteridine diphosphokinase [Gammaproteobacteria bacterium]